MVTAVGVLAFVRAALPAPPARVLEVGAGNGELAATLREIGYDVLAIDPASETAHVLPAALHEVQEPDGSFDAAVAVLSLHHVEPLHESCQKLAALVRPGGRVVIDEFDVERFDERAARWWLGQRAAVGAEQPAEPATLVSERREHLHWVSHLRDELALDFALGEPVRGPFLYRWGLGESLCSAEEHLVATGALPATGARLVGRRRAATASTVPA